MRSVPCVRMSSDPKSNHRGKKNIFWVIGKLAIAVLINLIWTFVLENPFHELLKLGRASFNGPSFFVLDAKSNFSALIFF